MNPPRPHLTRPARAQTISHTFLSRAIVGTLLATLVSINGIAAAGEKALPKHLLEPEQVEAISAADFEQVLESHKGKAILLNLWATWCIPCVQELPDLNLLQQRYGEKGLVVLAVSMDDPATLEEKVRPFFKERAPDLVSYLNSEADEYAFIDPIDPEWIGALPTTFFFKPDGSLHKQHAGRMLYKDLEREVLPLLPKAN